MSRKRRRKKTITESFSWCIYTEEHEGKSPSMYICRSAMSWGVLVDGPRCFCEINVSFSFILHVKREHQEFLTIHIRPS